MRIDVMASKLPLLLLLIAITCLSQFYRVSNSVIAPDLMRDLHLDAREFGWAGSAFFLALFAVQLPVGLWFDRFGARRTSASGPNRSDAFLQSGLSREATRVPP